MNSLNSSLTKSPTGPLPTEIFPVCLAPMVGLSHLAMKNWLLEYVPEGTKLIWPSEMLSSKRMISQNQNHLSDQLHGLDFDHIFAPQLLANEEQYIAPSVKKLQSWGAHAIDINMGCPVKKALRHNYGVALMGDPEYAFNVVKMTVQSSQIPVSVKIRAGMNRDHGFLLDFVDGLFSAGASWVCLHPRTAEQKRRGNADWNQIEMLTKKYSQPIIGNGDIQGFEDVFRMRETTGCRVVMVGRALTIRPWMLWQVGEKLGYDAPPNRSGESAPFTPEEESRELHRAFLRLLFHFQQVFPEAQGIRKLLFFVRVAAVWLQFGHHLQAQLSRCKTYDLVHQCFEDFFSTPQKIMKTTQLRY